MPSLVPNEPTYDETVYLVLEDFGELGQAFNETDPHNADLETLLRDLLDGQYDKPVGIIAFNIAEGWSRDVSKDTAREVVDRARKEDTTLVAGVVFFIEKQTGQEVEHQLCL